MQLLGAEVRAGRAGTRTLKDATNEAMRDWVTNVDDHALHHRLRGRARIRIPRMVRDFQSVIGREARAQMLARYGRLPDTVVACVGGGSNAMGIFIAFVDDAEVRAGRRRGRRARASSRATTAPRSARARPACCTAA